MTAEREREREALPRGSVRKRRWWEQHHTAKKQKKSGCPMTSSTPIDAAAGFRLVTICVAVSIAAELILWAWAYRAPQFKALRVSLSFFLEISFFRWGVCPNVCLKKRAAVDCACVPRSCSMLGVFSGL